MQPQAAILGAALASQIEHGLATAPRSRQREIGASEIGFACGRRLSYRLHGTAKTNFTDPLRLMVGLGVHGALAEIYAANPRYLVEYPIAFRGIRGTLDLYDRATATVIDWKTTSKSRLASYAKQGPPLHYITQINIYAAALMEQGFLVSRVALAFLPIDGTLSGIWVHLAEPDKRIALGAAERVLALASVEPSNVLAQPDRYCGWCDYYLPTSTDLSIGCPGTK